MFKDQVKKPDSPWLVRLFQTFRETGLRFILFFQVFTVQIKKQVGDTLFQTFRETGLRFILFFRIFTVQIKKRESDTLFQTFTEQTKKFRK